MDNKSHSFNPPILDNKPHVFNPGQKKAVVAPKILQVFSASEPNVFPNDPNHWEKGSLITSYPFKSSPKEYTVIGGKLTTFTAHTSLKNPFINQHPSDLTPNRLFKPTLEVVLRLSDNGKINNNKKKQ